MRIIRERATRAELARVAEEVFGDMVKAVVDVRRRIMAIGGELHSDEEALLMDDGSRQEDLWGINLYPGEPSDEVQGAGHREAARRWGALPLVEQLAHVGSEVERSIRAHEAGRDARFQSALDRALELFDLTAADERWRGPRRREILRAREEFCRLFFDEEAPQGSARGLRAYFLAFAVAARSRAGGGVS